MNATARWRVTPKGHTKAPCDWTVEGDITDSFKKCFFPSSNEANISFIINTTITDHTSNMRKLCKVIATKQCSSF